MPSFASSSRAIGAHKARPRWETTRRVAYDADEEDAQTPLQPFQSGWNPQTHVKPLTESNQNVNRSCARLKQSRRRSDSRPRENPASQNGPKPQQRRDRTKVLGTPTLSPKLNAAVSAGSSAPNQEAKNPNDDWIICERYKERPGWQQGYYGGFFKTSDGIWDFKAARRQPEGSLGYFPKPKSKPKTEFTDLPPEIRNTIYQYAIPKRSVLILRRHPNKEAEDSKRYWSEEHVTRRPRQSRLMYEPEWNQTSEDFGAAVKLMLTCKRIRTEVETFLYSGIQFCFHDLKSLRSFLRTAPKSGIGAIRSVFIRQEGYGNARAVEHQQYRERYYKGWEQACAQLGEKVTNLQHLKLMVRDREWPCVLSGKEYTPAWGESILKSAPALLPKVEVRVHHKMIDRNQEVLKDLARRVEDRMMTLAGREERDRIEAERVLAQIAARKAAKEEKERRRLAKLNAPPPPTELVISMDDIQKHVGKSVVVNKVRREGLDKFTKITPTNNPYIWYPGQNN